jgi:hypothetical protein
LPPALRGWKPPDLLPQEKRLPNPGWEFDELEAMLALGYTLRAWQAETPEDRARLVAFHLHRLTREAWTRHALRPPEAKPAGTPFDGWRKKFFG